jgi:hypothetical protein
MSESVTSRTAVYGPVRTVVWQGSVGDHRPYADRLSAAAVHEAVASFGRLTLDADDDLRRGRQE